MEVWKDIEGYEGLYQVSSIGRIKSLHGRTPRILRTRFNKGNYERVNLNKNGKKKTFTVHALVAGAFLNYNSNKDLVVDHIDNNQQNNCLKNLQLITQRENTSKDKDDYSSKFTGVYINDTKTKWRACIKVSGKTIHLGSFKTEECASMAYQKKLKEIESPH